MKHFAAHPLTRTRTDVSPQVLKAQLAILKQELDGLSALDKRFDALNARVDALATRVTAMDNGFGILQHRFERTNASLISMTRSAAINHNRHCAEGGHLKFEVVPFINGSDPVATFDLPPLYSSEAVEELSAANSFTYHTGYYPGQPVPEDSADCKAAIIRAIACEQK